MGYDPLTFGIEQLGAQMDKDRNLDASKELMDYQDALNNKNWEKQVEYYSPQNVMDRFKAAGLNPHLIYGAGAQSLTAAGNIGNVSMGSYSSKTEPVKNMLARQITAAQVNNMREQNLNLKEQNKVLSAEAEVKQAQARATELSNRKMEAESPYWGQNAFVDSEDKLLGNNIRQIERDIKKNEQYMSGLDSEFYFDRLTHETNILYQRAENLKDEDLKLIAETAVLYAQTHLMKSQGALNFALARKALTDALLNETENFIKGYEKRLVERGIDPDLSPEYRQVIGIVSALLGVSIDSEGNVHTRVDSNIGRNVERIRNRVLNGYGRR